MGGDGANHAPSAVTRTPPWRSQRGEHGADAALDEALGGARDRHGVGLQAGRVGAGQRGELLAVGLHQVGCRAGEGRHQGRQRLLAGVHGDARRGTPQRDHQLGVPPGRAPRAAGTRPAPPSRPTPARVSRPSSMASQHVRVDRRAGAVELGGGAVRLGDGQVHPHVAGRARRAAVDPVGAEPEHERVVLGGGQDGDRGDLGRDGGAGDVDALAAALGGHRVDPLDRAADQRPGRA